MFTTLALRRSIRGMGYFPVLLALLSATKTGAVPPGDYTGWAYEREGGDFPLRLSLQEEKGKSLVRISFPHLKAYLMECKVLENTPTAISFEKPNRQGQVFTYKAEWKDNALRGEAAREAGQDAIEFQLHPAAEPVIMASLKDPQAYRGTYADARRTIVISQWFWGELQAFDTGNGRVATLFQTPRDDFIMGPAMYVPAPISARIAFDKNPAGEVTQLRLTLPGQAPLTLNRLQFVETDVPFPSDKAKMEGTLVTPAHSGPLPLVVVLGGSDWTVRGQVRRETDIFASFGMAAFAFDARGQGKSGGDPVHTFDQTARDVCAALQALKERPEVDATRIGVFGRSRGGWFAPLAASMCNDISFVVTFVPPAVSPAEQEFTRRMGEIKAAGLAEKEVAEAADHLKLQFEATESDAAWERYVKDRDRLADRQWMGIAGTFDSRDDDDYHWSKLNMHYDPLPALEKVKCPLLALFGERDANVTPEQNVGRMRTALAKAANSDVTLRVLPEADHGLRPVKPGEGTLLHRSVGYVPEVWTTVREWLMARSLLGARTKDQ